MKIRMETWSEELARERSQRLTEALQYALRIADELERARVFLRTAPACKFRGQWLIDVLEISAASAAQTLESCTNLGDGWYCLRPQEEDESS